MSKVLIIGDCLNGSGYANALIGYAKSLKAVGYDVVLRYVRMTRPIKKIDPEVQEMLDKDVNNIACVFQWNLPSEFSIVNSGAKNIGGYAYETDKLPENWLDNLSQLDHVIVPSKFQLEQIKGIKSSVVPHAIDTNRVSKESIKMNFGSSDSTLKFYTICEFNNRKNIHAIVSAYLAEFDKNDDVVLVIKTHIPGVNPEQSKIAIRQHLHEIKKSLRRFSNENDYARISLISDYLSSEAIDGIHKNCDIFISASRGEAFGLPAFDAYMFGNQLILSRCTSYDDYFSGLKNVNFIDGWKEQCQYAFDANPGYYTSNELWYNASIFSLREKMRLSLKKDKDLSQVDWIKSNFSYESVGNKLKEIIDAK